MFRTLGFGASLAFRVKEECTTAMTFFVFATTTAVVQFSPTEAGAAKRYFYFHAVPGSHSAETESHSSTVCHVL